MSIPHHYGWPVSPYSGKTRAYLRYKGIPFENQALCARKLYLKVRKNVGRMIMPTVELPDGTWLQDSSDIIDWFEQHHPEPSITPPRPDQRVASLLLETFADEWLPAVALHYRWNYPENARFARREFARYGLPGIPGMLARRVTNRMADRMQGYLAVHGVADATIPAVEQTARELIAALETHLAGSPYVLGGRPCLGDFALFGPLWAHLYRDPGSTFLFDGAPAVEDWMRRLEHGEHTPGDWADDVPETLDPVFQLIVDDVLPWMHQLVGAIDAYCDAHPDATRVPRSLGPAEFTIRGRSGTRKLVTFSQWKLQRPRRAYEEADGAADPWLARFTDDPAGAIPAIAHPFARVDFKEVLA